jgi:YHS domain-containing protein
VTRSSILAVLGLAACASSAPTAAPTAAPASAAAPAAAPDAGCDGDCDEGPTPAATTSASASASAHDFKRVKPSADYPLNACLITGEELGDVADRVAFSYDGTEVQFCCPGCAKKFEKNPAPYLAKLAAAKPK